MMSAQAQTRRTMSNALALLEDLMESIDGGAERTPLADHSRARSHRE